MQVSNNIKMIAGVISALLVIAGVAWKAFELDSRAFSKMENRVHGEQVLQELDPVKVAEDRVRDSVYQIQTREARAKRDSALNQLLKVGHDMEEFMKRQDCLNVRLNDQYFQLNQKLTPETADNTQ